MQWTHPETIGDLPPPSRAHTATLINDRRIVVYGGGQGTQYYDTVFVFDTTTRRWSKPAVQGDVPPPRRAHTAVLYKGKIWVFGGGNGMQALNDVWTLDLGMGERGVGGGGSGHGHGHGSQGGQKGAMKWTKITTKGNPTSPSPRGYHTANVIGDTMVIIGGSDGKDCFSEVWLFNLGLCLIFCLFG
jgi:Rab9 effector protein with kelch motifs